MRAHTAAIGAAILVATSLALSAIAPASAQTAEQGAADVAKTAVMPLRGISVAGGEFSSVSVPRFDSAASFAFLASRGYTVVRIPFLWESVQPTLGGPLDDSATTRVEGAVEGAASAGLKVILDVHDYGRYRGIAYGASGSFTLADFTDLWTRLSTVFRHNPAVVGYGLMNEPHDLPAVDGVSGNVRWQRAQQAALDAIRANGDVTCVLISGYTYSTLGGWFNPSSGQPVPYITDPADNFRWEAHDYWDADSTGTYGSSYSAAVKSGYGTSQGDAERTRVYSQLALWITWLEKNHQKGYIGEFGWPSQQNAVSPTDAADWNNLATLYLQRVNQTQGDLLWTTAWATGTAWNTGYALQYYGSTNGVLSTPLSNAPVLEENARELNPSVPAPAPTPVAVVPGANSSPVAAATSAAVVARKPSSSIRVVVAGHRRHPRLTIRVRSGGRVTGTVRVTMGKRVLARAVKLRHGRAVVTIRARLSARAHRLVVRYAGTTSVAASRARVTVRVPRK